MSSTLKYALSEINNYLAGFAKNKVLLTYSAWLLSLIYLQVNSFQTGSLKATVRNLSRLVHFVPVRLSFKGSCANPVLAGHGDTSERAVKSEHQDLWILF